MKTGSMVQEVQKYILDNKLELCSESQIASVLFACMKLRLGFDRFDSIRHSILLKEMTVSGKVVSEEKEKTSNDESVAKL